MRTLSLNKPHLIIMAGIPGSGKSFFAENFSDTFNAPIISFSNLQADLFNTPSFSREETAIISRVARRFLGELLKTKQTIIYDGEAAQRTDRTMLAKQAHAAGYETLLVWVQTDPTTARLRSTKPSKRVSTPRLTREQFEAGLKRFSAPHPTESPVVISGKHTYASQLKTVLHHLVEPRVASEASQPPVLPARPTTPPGRSILIR